VQTLAGKAILSKSGITERLIDQSNFSCFLRRSGIVAVLMFELFFVTNHAARMVENN
jgi:hypothetical protein